MSHLVGEGAFVLGCVHHRLRNASMAIFIESFCFLFFAFPPDEKVLSSLNPVTVRPLEAAQVGWPQLTDAGNHGPDGTYQRGS